MTRKHVDDRTMDETALLFKVLRDNLCFVFYVCVPQASVRLPAQHLRPVMWSLLPRLQPVSMETSHDLQCQWMWTWVLLSLCPARQQNKDLVPVGASLTHCSQNMISFSGRLFLLCFLDSGTAFPLFFPTVLFFMYKWTWHLKYECDFSGMSKA